MQPEIPGTQGYSDEAPSLLKRYEAIDFFDAHGPLLAFLPERAITILDIGAGTGRDASAFARLGHKVTAVEPTAPMREGGRILHAKANIDWLDDALPELTRLGETRFDLLHLSAVFMHLDAHERIAAMARLATLTSPGAILHMTLRHGPVPKGRRMFEVSGDDVVARAAQHGFRTALLQHEPAQSAENIANGVTWTRVILRKDQCDMDEIEGVS